MASGVKLAGLCAALGTALGIVTAPAVADPATVGAPGVGDPYYPLDGNGGYDIGHYDIRLNYQPATDELWGTTTILATTTQELSQFDLDFLLKPSSVLVNNRPARFESREDGELVVTPASTVAAGTRLLVVVTYRDTPSRYTYLGFSAWHRDTNAAWVAGEPHSSRWWYPGSDHPSEKATFDVSIAVPTGLEAVSNGVFVNAVPQTKGWTRYFWRGLQPQGPYQGTMIVADMDMNVGTAPGGQQFVTAYFTSLTDGDADSARTGVERTPEYVDWESSLFGPYPFDAMGGTVIPGYGGLEHQTRPTYGANSFTSGSPGYVVVHELAHQWFGDSVSFHNWSDAWLSEGFATYAEWLYSEHIGEGTAAEVADYWYSERYPADDPFWDTVVADPGAGDSNFASAIYRRGAMTLQAVRTAIGDDTFFALLKHWAAAKKGGSATTAEFEAFASKDSGQDLSGLFHTWLHTTGKPPVGPSAARAAATPRSIPHLEH